MATEEGVVIRTDATTAWVKAVKTSACKSCAAKDTCHTIGGGEEIEIEAVNHIGAENGDTVVIGFPTESLLKVSFLVYLLPVIFMFVGALLGKHFSPIWQVDENLSSAFLAFLFFGVAFFIVRNIGNRISQKDEYRAKIIRIKRKGKPA